MQGDLRPRRTPLANHMPSTRLSLRLGQLPHDVLAALAARLCSESPALQAVAEECMAVHKPLSHELVERVLLSPDLVPSILGPLEAKDGAAAAVCSQWLAGWKATNKPPWPRRRLKQVPLELPVEIDTSGDLEMAASPDGRLVVTAPDACRKAVHVLDNFSRPRQKKRCTSSTAACVSYIRWPASAYLVRQRLLPATCARLELRPRAAPGGRRGLTPGWLPAMTRFSIAAGKRQHNRRSYHDAPLTTAQSRRSTGSRAMVCPFLSAAAFSFA